MRCGIFFVGISYWTIEQTPRQGCVCFIWPIMAGSFRLSWLSQESHASDPSGEVGLEHQCWWVWRSLDTCCKGVGCLTIISLHQSEDSRSGGGWRNEMVVLQVLWMFCGYNIYSDCGAFDYKFFLLNIRHESSFLGWKKIIIMRIVIWSIPLDPKTIKDERL